MIKKMPLNILQPKNYRYTHRLVPAGVIGLVVLFLSVMIPLKDLVFELEAT